ncbi:MAG: hypothetical protein R6U38_03980, partial [Desulfatiglandaceae bacterium]
VDTYLYARAIETFEGPIIHFGYYVMGGLCHLLFKPMGVTPLQTLGYISQFFGAVSVAGMYGFTFLLTENRLQSVLSAVILMFSAAFWLFSIHGEVYVPQLAFVLLSLIFMLKIRPLLSSLSILAAVSITPTSLLALLPLGYIAYMKGIGRRYLLYFSMPILLAFIAVMSWKGAKVMEAFANAVYFPNAFVDPFSYSSLFSLLTYKLIRAYGNSFNLIFLFALFGFAVLCIKDRRRWGLMTAFLVPFLAYFFNLGLFSADHLIISFIAVSFLGAYGILRLLDMMHASRNIRIGFIILLLCFHVWSTYERAISRQRSYAAELGRVVHELSEKYQANGIMLTDFDFGVIFFSMMEKEYPLALLKGSPNEFLMKEGSPAKAGMQMLQGKFWIQFGHLLDVASLPGFRSLVGERPVYFVDRKFWPIGAIQLHNKVKELFGIQDKSEAGRLKKIREYLAYKLDAEISLEKAIDSPLYPVYLMQAK